MKQTPNRGMRSVLATAICIGVWTGIASGQDESKWQNEMQQAASARQSGQLEESEKFLKTALEEAEKFGPADQRVLVTLDALGTYYYTKGVYVEALPIYTKILELRESVIGQHHPLVANALTNMAIIESVLKKADEAEAHSERAVKISEDAAAGMTNITAIAAGTNHTCLIVDGHVHCFGANINGQLGVPSPGVSAYPVALPGISNATALAAGASFTCALLADHTVSCWGTNTSGQTGAAASRWTAPHPVPGVTGARAIAAGSEHACALLEAGTMKCWGSNQKSQLGNGTKVDSAVPVDVNAIKGAKAIAAGGNHTCATTPNGGVACWGEFASGTSAVASPAQVPGLTGNLNSLVAGSNYACALLADGNVSCWWGTKPPAPGAATPTSPFTAAEIIKDASPAKSIAAGYAHTCVILGDGSVRCWGNNREGQLGNGQAENSWTPVAVQNIKTATAITAGLAHTCALLADKTVSCWGSDSYGAPQGLLFGFRSHLPLQMGRDELSLASSLTILAEVYRNSAKYDKADSAYQRTLQLLEKSRGTEDMSLVPVLNSYAEMLRKAGRVDDAAKIESRAQSISFKPTLTDVPTAPPPQK